jgi:hypothetical protein
MTHFRGLFVIAVLNAAMVSTAAAQAARTWVSGVGDDANPCSRTAPCRTFAGAISKTAAGGEIDALDPGDFGAVTITKSITLDGRGTFAGSSGVTVNAAAVVVVLRGLSIRAAGAATGIGFITGAALHVEDCAIGGAATSAIDFAPSLGGRLTVKGTAIRLRRHRSTSPRHHGHDRKIQADRRGLDAGARQGFGPRQRLRGQRHASSPGLRRSTSMRAIANAVGVQANSTVRLSEVMVVITRPKTGRVVSFGNNRIAAETANGSPASTVPGVTEPCGADRGEAGGAGDRHRLRRRRRGAGGQDLGLGRRRRPQPLHQDGTLQDLRGRAIQDGGGRRDRRPGFRGLRRGDHHQVDHARRRNDAGELSPPGQGIIVNAAGVVVVLRGSISDARGPGH